MLNTKQLNSIGFTYIIGMAEPCSPYGAELARRPRFYLPSDYDELQAEFSRITALIRMLGERTDKFERVERILMQFKDVRRSIERTKLFTLSDVELFEFKRFLLLMERLAPAYADLMNGEKLAGISIKSFTAALDIIDPDGMRSMTFRVSDRFSDELASIRSEHRRLDIALRTASAEDKERISIEITTLAAREENEEAIVRTQMTKGLSKYADEILMSVAIIGKLDFAMAKSRLCVRQNGIIPNVLPYGDSIGFSEMRNPFIEAALREKGKAFTPITIDLRPGSTVITGANMGGKSVTAKTLALNVMLGLSGFPVFASDASLVCLGDVELLSEDREDAMSGLSSFGGEMVSFNEMITKSRSYNYLVLLDEFARGTNPHEGAALVRAAVKYYNDHDNNFALITTHFDDVAKYANKHYQVMGLKTADTEMLRHALAANGAERTGVIESFMNYGIFEVPKAVTPPRDAITICMALGIDDEFMKLIEI